MGYLEEEDKKFLDEVNAVKEWWKDPRWRYTKRPFTAEQIVAKRGNLPIEYPANTQSKKLWNIVESNFKVRFISIFAILPMRKRNTDDLLSPWLYRTKLLVSRMDVLIPRW